MNKLLIALIALFFSIEANADIQTTQTQIIKQMYAYDDFGAVPGAEGADIALWLETGISSCPNGVWLSPSAPSYKTLTSFLLTAFTSNIPVRFQVYDDQIWTGSSKSLLCKIDAIRFVK
ncbi:hypothetical protein [Enterovibrio norvegicus]|uniref:Uncharacterized protein n=1 Tax=Enterovibrio norvegicus TaxID=188144 RepID=A0ABV4KX37_9GAMM|nr:hypothetical protein [Enterovibrio norvegicus]OEF58632.1 hypothetical protein A1OU_10765 [Enterovibrio norvegicus]PMH72653.1 hypothetical protein BCU62_03265 [Enterovibrio norvegicus]